MLFRFDHVTFGYAGVPVVEDVTFELGEGERVGFLGGNGEGKTTVLRLLTGELVPDGGTVSKKSKLRLGYLEQSGGFSDMGTVYSAMEAVFEEDKQLLSRLEEVQKEMGEEGADLRVLAARAENLNRQIAARDSYHYRVKIETVLNGMGFADFYDHPVPTMSGGEKTKLKLCRLLLEEPDLLVLDEPTNHLDIKTLFWLEEYLASFKGALLIVSHDRYFLDRLTSRTLELERGRLTAYKGNYSRYKVLKAERIKTLEREYERQQEEIAKLKDYVDRNIVRATTAKSALSRVNRLERMEILEKPVLPPPPPRFVFSYDEKPYEKVIDTDIFDLSAGGKTLLKSVKFTLMRGRKCALVGDNGTGKTTLLKFLLSKDPRVRYGRFVRIAYYDQENADLDPEERVLDAFWGKYALLSQTDARKLLAQAGLDAEDIGKKVKELSGGLRAKLELSLLEARRGNVLVLDEPTNHLDLPARESLEEALRAFDGTLLFVSHDRRFIESVSDCILLLEDGKLTFFDGSYQDFLQSRKTVSPPTMSANPPRKTENYRSKEERAKEAQRRVRTKEIETRLEALEREEAELNESLIRCASDYKKVAEITQRLSAIHAESDALYEEYETLI